MGGVDFFLSSGYYSLSGTPPPLTFSKRIGFYIVSSEKIEMGGVKGGGGGGGGGVGSPPP